jgi:hypothetical protein
VSEPNFNALSFSAGDVFTPGSPINGRDLFAGRLDQVNRILDAISQRGYHAVLYGERGIGKTSLSNVLSEFLHDAGRTFLLPRVNCDVSDDFSSLWRKILQDVVVTEHRPKVGFSAEQVETTRRIIDDLPEEITPDDVRRVLDTLARGVTLVVVFDEFDRLTEPRVRGLMADTIKSLSDYGCAATILVIGVADSVSGLIHEHQSIERVLMQIPMPRMSLAEIRQIVMNGLTHLNMGIDEGSLEEIANLSQGLPYITHLLSLHGVRSALAAKNVTVTSSNIEVGIKASLEQWQQSIKSAYYEATRSQQPGHLYKEVILACALADMDDLGYFSAAGVRTPLRVITGKQYDIPNFARHLKELSEPGRGDMLERVGGTRRLRYRFRSPLMRPYIVMRGFAESLLTKGQMYQISNIKT